MPTQQDFDTLAVVPFDFTDCYGTIRLYVTLIDWHYHGMQPYSWVDAVWLHKRATQHPDYDRARQRYRNTIHVRQMRDEASLATATTIIERFYAHKGTTTRHPFRDDNREPMPWPGTAPPKVFPMPTMNAVEPQQQATSRFHFADHADPSITNPHVLRRIQADYTAVANRSLARKMPHFGSWVSALQDTIDAKEQYLGGRCWPEYSPPRYAGGYGNEYWDDMAKYWGRGGVTGGHVAITQRGDYWQDSTDCDVQAHHVIERCGFYQHDEDDQAQRRAAHQALTGVFRAQQEWLPPPPPTKGRQSQRGK